MVIMRRVVASEARARLIVTSPWRARDAGAVCLWCAMFSEKPAYYGN